MLGVYDRIVYDCLPTADTGNLPQLHGVCVSYPILSWT